MTAEVEAVCPASSKDTPPPERYSETHAIVVCLFVALTGFFHGYDNGVIGDIYTMAHFRNMMGWPAEDNALTASSMAINTDFFCVGAGLAAMLSGILLMDRYGRKPALILGTFLFAAGGLVQSLSTGPWQMYIGRLIAGVGVGITSCAGPSYISEVAPARIRGAMVGVYQSNICVAIVAAAIINNFAEGSAIGWRLSLGVQTFLGVATLIGFPFLRETPRFLENKGRSEEAYQVLKSLRAGNEAAASKELEMVKAEIKEEQAVGQASWTEIFTNPFFRNVVIIGCLTQFCQIMSGINAIVMYFGTLLVNLHMKSFGAQLLPWIAFTVGNAIGSFYLADRAGRRPLFVWGMVAMALSLLVAGIAAFMASSSTAAGYLVIAAVASYMFSFGISWGFGAWLYVSEVMPLRIRGSAVGLCTMLNWGPGNLTTGALTPFLIASSIGPGGTLIFYGVVCSICIPFAMTCLPETKGKTLEEITPLFRFAGWGGFMNFLRGNLHGGQGAAYCDSKNMAESTKSPVPGNTTLNVGPESEVAV